MNNKNELYYDLVEEINLLPGDLKKVKDGKYPNGRKFPINLKEKCIFRGVSKKEHKLIPKALRTNKNEEYEICKYLNSDKPTEYHSIAFRNIGCANTKELTLPLQYKRELFVLFRFLDWADKSGLKIPVSMSVRKLLHSHINHFPGYWPKSAFYEVISLAQHYGLPTCALDWSYDYKVALYFAVKNILKKDTSNCVLWAFNYKYFEKYSTFVVEEGLKSQNKPQLRFYRPRYYNNSNLKAQKGLFTFLINKPETFKSSLKPLDEMVCDMVQGGMYKKNSNSEIEIGICGLENFTLEKNEKIFYKFIIPGECKYKILKELYTDGYSEEYLFPGYWGVAKAMKNRADFENLEDKFKNYE